jgi:hypothetical protein
LRKRHAVPSAMIFCGLFLIMGVERTEGQTVSSPLALRAQKRKGSAETIRLSFLHGEQGAKPNVFLVGERSTK